MLALTITLAESTSRRKRIAFGWFSVRIASVWCEPWRLMCAMASSRPATTFTLMIGARYSSAQSASVASASAAPGTACRIARAFGSQRISTPLAAKIAPMRGRKAGAIAACTSSDSVALHGLYFCVFALSVTRSASSSSALAST